MADMTAVELYELVTRPSPGLPDGWPEEVRPEGLWYDTKVRLWREPVFNGKRWADEAVLAHVAAAVEWLGKRDIGFEVNIMLDRDGEWWVGDFIGPTLLHALDAAVRAVGGGG